ncbi:YncE family protein [Plesiocystis pacifica]|uniref:YncE family protein n=1 Tax=Plesiocystis pacifica TaxID=191768 RepID=UPI0012FAE2FC|nr:YncE family protein [Plesiocystis pacifica]
MGAPRISRILTLASLAVACSGPEPAVTPSEPDPAGSELAWADTSAAPWAEEEGRGRAKRRKRSDYRVAPPMLELSARISTGSLPKSVEVSPDGAHVVVANFGYQGHDNLWRWTTAGLERAGRMGFDGNAVETLFSADGSRMFVSSFSGAKVIEADAKTMRARHTYSVGINPKVMALSPDERLLWVANWSAHSVTAVDRRRRKAVDHFRVGHHPRGMVVDEQGRVYVNAMYSHQIHVLEFVPKKSGYDEIEELRVMPVCEYPRHVIWSPGRDALIVSCSGEDRVATYDPETGEELDSAAVGDNPRTISASLDGRFIAVANFTGGTVSVIDTVARVVHEHAVPGVEQIVGVAVEPRSCDEPLRVYATNWQGNELLVFDGP